MRFQQLGLGLFPVSPSADFPLLYLLLRAFLLWSYFVTRRLLREAHFSCWSGQCSDIFAWSEPLRHRSRSERPPVFISIPTSMGRFCPPPFFTSQSLPVRDSAQSPRGSSRSDAVVGPSARRLPNSDSTASCAPALVSPASSVAPRAFERRRLTAGRGGRSAQEEKLGPCHVSFCQVSVSTDRLRGDRLWEPRRIVSAMSRLAMSRLTPIDCGAIDCGYEAASAMSRSKWSRFRPVDCTAIDCGRSAPCIAIGFALRVADRSKCLIPPSRLITTTTSPPRGSPGARERQS